LRAERELARLKQNCAELVLGRKANGIKGLGAWAARG